MKSGIARLNPVILAVLRLNPRRVADWYMSVGLRIIVALHNQSGIAPL